ncbi:DUF1572 family protein [Sulfoacidibacillus thermotolerans]|uniref:DUF1572 domain-containing protein n=1 Tax=Sulfoacidibacillus thermotolerans TaxID=1765684 RepID=A0A2U3D745_SULT2|nr:DUF1572 family protein [Sulfoacidibacillus thermotolerans]PWI57110.1 hypothetical protein BM613_10145 [Sulfoacidibacillus thermotolerans]
MEQYEESVATMYLAAIRQQFQSIKDLGDRTLEQLEEQQLHFTPNEESNNIATIIKHLHGNMRSRWTDFLTSDGEKPDRKRDEEFIDRQQTKNEILELWNMGWKITFAAIEALTPADLIKTVYIRQEPHTVIQAIERQISHYSNHVGQIIYIGKLLTNTAWKTLTIPRNRSL